jgi:hypothetical protein
MQWVLLVLGCFLSQEPLGTANWRTDSGTPWLRWCDSAVRIVQLQVKGGVLWRVILLEGVTVFSWRVFSDTQFLYLASQHDHS